MFRRIPRWNSPKSITRLSAYDNLRYRVVRAQSDNVERLMWAAARSLEEQSEYTDQLAVQMASISATLSREYRGLSRSALHKAIRNAN